MRALILTHGDIGTELVRVAGMILGPQTDLTAASNAGRSAAELQALVEAWLGEDDAAPALIMVDDFGGSCATAARLACGDRAHRHILSGVNLSMVLGYLTWRGTVEADELVQRIVDKGREAIVKLGGA